MTGSTHTHTGRYTLFFREDIAHSHIASKSSVPCNIQLNHCARKAAHSHRPCPRASARPQITQLRPLRPALIKSHNYRAPGRTGADNRSEHTRRLNCTCHTHARPPPTLPPPTPRTPRTIYTKLISNNYTSVAEILNKHKYPFDVIAVCVTAHVPACCMRFARAKYITHILMYI